MSLYQRRKDLRGCDHHAVFRRRHGRSLGHPRHGSNFVDACRRRRPWPYRRLDVLAWRSEGEQKLS